MRLVELYQHRDPALASALKNQRYEVTMDDVDAFILVGGWAQFGPQAYAQVTDQVMDGGTDFRCLENDRIAGDECGSDLAGEYCERRSEWRWFQRHRR